MKINYYKWATRLMILGVCSFLFAAYLFIWKSGETPNLWGNINTEFFDRFGSFIGGTIGMILSFASTMLLIHTIHEQDIDAQKQKIESRFFELLKFHRENCNEIKLQAKEGREVFKWLQREFYKCYEVVDFSTRGLTLSNKDKINLAYISFFFGAVGEHSSKIVREYLKNYDVNVINKLIDDFKQPIISEAEKNKFPYKIFDGHQLRLGNYFRHLFQTIKYIDEQPNKLLTYEQKYEYIKTLRAQLSNQEQTLFFFNSLSILGKKWELEEGLDDNKKLITKYNLITNIPEKYVTIGDVRDFYPDVKFEIQNDDTINKKKMLKKYS
jgi:Putative phage abortive infection protein